ncbi:MAG: hypothetical protein GY952_14055 [Rhodobacteraceae bacterium]|nr:hypothetical protein [Paracoccaceae bacterium]
MNIDPDQYAAFQNSLEPFLKDARDGAYAEGYRYGLAESWLALCRHLLKAKRADDDALADRIMAAIEVLEEACPIIKRFADEVTSGEADQS